MGSEAEGLAILPITNHQSPITLHISVPALDVPRHLPEG